MKPLRSSDLFLGLGLASLTILILVLVVFSLDFKRQGPGVGRGISAAAVLASQENAKEDQTHYFDAGHGYVYQVQNNSVTAVLAYGGSSYPFAFACGTSVMNGSSVNIPLVQGDILFQQYPRGDVYPTWNRVTGVYQEINSLADMSLDPTKAAPVSLADVYGETVAIQKESCVDMTAAASFVSLICFIGFGIALVTKRKRANV